MLMAFAIILLVQTAVNFLLKSATIPIYHHSKNQTPGDVAKMFIQTPINHPLTISSTGSTSQNKLSLFHVCTQTKHMWLNSYDLSKTQISFYFHINYFITSLSSLSWTTKISFRYKACNNTNCFIVNLLWTVIQKHQYLKYFMSTSPSIKLTRKSPKLRHFISIIDPPWMREWITESANKGRYHKRCNPTLLPEKEWHKFVHIMHDPNFLFLLTVHTSLCPQMKAPRLHLNIRCIRTDFLRCPFVTKFNKTWT